MTPPQRPAQRPSHTDADQRRDGSQRFRHAGRYALVLLVVAILVSVWGIAKADLATAQANADLARITAVRWKGLLANEAVSQQDADTRTGQAAASEATATSAQANVARLKELESFKRVVAPFDGVVTARNTDIGALINAGESTGTGWVRVASMNKLRVYADVPEPYATQVKPGIGVQLRFT
jgi:multidrug efflux pump subunit AcrA (membrane-fusion protein)